MSLQRETASLALAVLAIWRMQRQVAAADVGIVQRGHADSPGSARIPPRPVLPSVMRVRAKTFGALSGQHAQLSADTVAGLRRARKQP